MILVRPSLLFDAASYLEHRTEDRVSEMLITSLRAAANGEDVEWPPKEKDARTDSK